MDDSADQEESEHQDAALAPITSALEVADLRVLVACLFHMTGDDRWLAGPYRPARDVRLIADPGAGFSEAIRAEILEAAQQWFLNAQADPDGGEPAILDPGSERFAAMLSVFLDEDVPSEYVPMIREDFGFEPADTQWATGAAPESTPLDVLIIGAGVSGLCLASKATQLGLDVSVVEKNADVGGTWFENRYPGCGVDTPNHFYSYSFAANPHWQNFFSPRDELQAYLQAFTDKFGLRQHINFDTTLTSASWDDAAQVWSVTLETGGQSREVAVRILVSATGHFNQPVAASFEGEEQFEGEVFHTARWPATADLKGKRVAVIGTGASAMQLVPTVASQVESMTIFQRTPQWARPVPEYNQAVDADSHWLFDNVPMYDRWYRFSQFWRYGDGLLRFLRKDPTWPHPDRSLNKTNDRHRQEMTDYITTQLESRPELVQKCLPEYPPFGKRILIDNGWFETLCRPNVTLVTDPIKSFSPSGIRTSANEVSDAADAESADVVETVHDCDVVVLATGFNVTDLAGRLNITGRDGLRLSDDWAEENPRANLGMTVPGFPNLFIMYGPNTNMGHGGSGMWLAETQTRYITDRLVEMVEQDIQTLECLPDRRDRYTEKVDLLHEELVWSHPGTKTYYRNQKGQVRSPMPFRLIDYWTMTRNGSLDDFAQSPRTGTHT